MEDSNHKNDSLQNNGCNGTESRQKPYYYYDPYESCGVGEQKLKLNPTSVSSVKDVSKDQSPISQSWIKSETRKNFYGISFFSYFLSALLVIGGLMFVSDRMSLFTGHKVFVGVSSSVSSSTNNKGSVKTAAMDVVPVRPTSIAQIVKDSSPAVVKIETLVKTQSSGGNSLFDDPFFRQFFGGAPNQQQPNQKQDSGQGNSAPLQPEGLGSGFIFEKSGYILTNEHVIDGADEIQVTVQGYDKPFTAKLLGNSYDLDLAVLKIEGEKDFPKLTLGNTEDTSVGDWVVAIGNPYGFDHTVTKGVLSAKERPIDIPDQKGTRTYKHLLQTDASINPGNSGGPLLNMNGDVIGINTAVSTQAHGIGFAIPTSTIQSVLDSLINNVKIPKEPVPYIGVSLGDIQASAVQDLQLDSTDGALVSDVVMSSPAFKAGIKTYDVIVSLNGTKIKTSSEVVAKIQTLKVGDKVTLTLIRDGKNMDVSVTLGDKNRDKSVPQN